MKNILIILLFTICANVWQISGQTVITQTEIIDAVGLKELVSSNKGKPVLLNFWATWCGPCHAEFPDLVKIDADYRKKGLVFNVVSVDTVGLIQSGVPEFLQNYKSTMNSYLIDLPNRREIAKAIRQIAPKSRDIYPLTFLFDKNGRLVFQKIGKVNAKLLRMEIDKVLPKVVLMSDSEFDGLKGNVKTVRYENVLYNLKGEIYRNREDLYTETTYDINGKKIEWISYQKNIPLVKTIYWIKDAAFFSKDERLNYPKQSDDNPPPPRKMNTVENVERDTSFNLKFIYNYDSNGNRIEKLIYGNDSKFISRRVYDYDSNRNKIKERVFTGDGTRYNDSSKYVYDSKGILVLETNFLGNGSGLEEMAKPNHRLTYLYLKFDNQGNWLERKVFDSIDNQNFEGEKKLIRIEYQTILYY